MFWWKKADIVLRSKFLTSPNYEHFWTKFTPIIFSFQRFFHFFLRRLKMLFSCFGAKMPTLYSGQNSWPVGQKGIFMQILTDLFFYSFLFFVNRIFHFFWDLWIYYLLVFMQKWWHCVLVEIESSNMCINTLERLDPQFTT